MSLELKSHPVAGYDGPKGDLFMLANSGTGEADDGWSVTYGNALPTGAPVIYVSDPDGKRIGTYSLSIEDICEEAIREAKKKKAQKGGI